MKPPHCASCGSTNHRTFDCVKADPVYEPPPDLEELAEAAPPPRPESTEPEPEETFDDPRWPGGPHICNATNLPAFPTSAAVYEFLEELPAVKSSFTRHCDKCKEWHFKDRVRGPSGSSSGSERENTLPLGFVPFRRRAGRESAFAQAEHAQWQDELPREERPDPPKKKIEAKPRRVYKGGRDGDLF